jgi:hypothetical protein
LTDGSDIRKIDRSETAWGLGSLRNSSKESAAHACNPRYSGGRDQKDHGWKPAQGNTSSEPILQKPITKIGLVEWLKVEALSSNPSTVKKKKKLF